MRANQAVGGLQTTLTYERPPHRVRGELPGSPAINLLDGELSTEAGVPCFRRGDRVVPFPQQAGTGSRAAVLGLRAEDTGAVQPGGPVMTGVVTTAVPAGSDQFLGLAVGGAEMFVRVGKDLCVNEGETVRLGLNPARLHLFVKAMGRSLLRGHAE